MARRDIVPSPLPLKRPENPAGLRTGAVVKTVDVTYRYQARGGRFRSRPLDAAAAQARLSEGNLAFASLLEGLLEGKGTANRIVEVDPHDLGFQSRRRGAARQRPFAVVLGCSDARVPIELIFNEGPNDLFVVRVAGNGLGTDVLGSLRYAMQHLQDSLKLIVVLGHSGCGALSAAADAFLDPAGYLPLAADHSLRSLLDRQLIAVQASARRLAREFGAEVTGHKGYRQALIETAIVTNAAFTGYAIRQELKRLANHQLRVVYGVYQLHSHQIWAPRGSTTETTGLAEVPADPASFDRFADATVRSERIASLLGTG